VVVIAGVELGAVGVTEGRVEACAVLVAGGAESVAVWASARVGAVCAGAGAGSCVVVVVGGAGSVTGGSAAGVVVVPGSWNSRSCGGPTVTGCSESCANAGKLTEATVASATNIIRN
jgi:hypothetical protein